MTADLPSDAHGGPSVAFLFPGQGSQRPGMGADWIEAWPDLATVLERADDALGFGLSKLCLEGPADELRLTANGQPAILLVSYLAAEVLSRHGIRPRVMAGHSLGELTALCVAGAYSLEDALRLVRLRGEAMQEAVPVGEGTMAALKTSDLDTLREVLDAVEPELGVVAPANFNGPQQTVISGHVAAVRRAVELAREGRILGRELDVSAPFHCELMRPAADRFSEALGEQEFAERLEPPVVTNVSAELVETGASAREFLALQVTHPVRWADCVERVLATGVDALVEVGPGKVLTGLNARISRDTEAWATDGPGAIEAVVERFGVRDDSRPSATRNG